MNFLRHLLLAAVLVFAQLAASAHAVEHLVQDEGSLPKHASELCLSAQNLGAALTSALTPPAVGVPYLVPEFELCNDRGALPAPPASQRAPPRS